MIYAVKRKAKRAKKLADQNSDSKPIIFRKQLHKLYSSLHLKNVKVHSNWKRLEPDEFGKYKLVIEKKERPFKSNYFSYAERASKIMNEPAIKKQLRNHKKIFNEAIKRHLE